MPPINKLTKQDAEVFAGMPGGTLGYYQHLAGRSVIYPGKGTPLGLIYCALKLNGEAGELAEHVGKAMRDDGWSAAMPEHSETFAFTDITFGQLTEARRELIIKELGDCLWYIAALSTELGLSLHDVATENLRKLADRSERDALRGSGDKR